MRIGARLVIRPSELTSRGDLYIDLFIDLFRDIEHSDSKKCNMYSHSTTNNRYTERPIATDPANNTMKELR